MNFSKSLGETFVKFNDLQTISKQLTALKKFIIFLKVVVNLSTLINFNDLEAIIKELMALITL